MVQMVHSRHTHCAFNRPLDDPSGNHQVLHETVEAWFATGTPLAFYDYNPHSTFAHAPFPAGRKMHRDAKWLHDRGFIGYHSQSEGTLWGIYGLNHLSLARSLWNVDLDYDAVAADYFRCLYGKAAEPVQALHEELERVMVEYPPVTTGLGAYLTPEVVSWARGLLREAVDAETSDAVQTRIGMLAAQMELGDRLAAAKRTAEAYERTKDRSLLLQLKGERDGILEYVKDNPVDGAYHLAGVQLKLEENLIGSRVLLERAEQEEIG
jgi:hypothetical protein